MPICPANLSAMTDNLTNGDQMMLLETLQQIEIINSPLPFEAVVQKEKNVHRDDTCDYAEQQEQRKARHTQTHETDSELERMRLEFELTVLKQQHEENDKQRLHEEKMEHIRQGSPSRSAAHVEEDQFVGKLDPITEIELEKLRMEFELAKLKHISEENERQRQHEQKLYEEKEKQRQHEEKMAQMHQSQGNLQIVSQKVSGCSPVEATVETASVAFAEIGKMRIELQLALQVQKPPQVKETKLSSEQDGHQESPKCEQPLETTPKGKKVDPPTEQRNDEVTEHLGLQGPRIVVNGAESQWSSSRLDIAIETELEKRRMEFELTRLRYEHEENERQRQHEQKMEQLRQQILAKDTA
ncbi:GRB10-interacting GYF protein 2-like [Erythrolamprus reginae]|uniref:GRB10-interacting GYF protein 2-like n=1 Tax=Erythrolamprus reginae TaxID=121349 RepID=UPI00396C6D0B